MERSGPAVVALVAAMGAMACGSAATAPSPGDGTLGPDDVAVEEPAPTTPEPGEPDEADPVVEAGEGRVDPVSAWSPYAEAAMALEQVDGPPGIPGFEPYERGLRLPDGRILVRGRWDGDEPIAGWYQPNPDAVAPGEPEPPITDRTDRPVRLFVVDPDDGSVTPISHVPVVRPFATAVSRGEGPDVVLQFVVLGGGSSVAYTAGFSGAAYDIPAVLHVVPLPPG